MKNNYHHNGRQQTHFIGVLVPDELSDQLEGCRSWMGSRFGCRSGFGTPLHITLIPPFCLPDILPADRVADAVSKAIGSCREKKILPFTVRVTGFGSFSERTVFAYVHPDERWLQLHSEIFNALSGSLPDVFRRDRRPFAPHITVANRDIPSGGTAFALKHFESLHLDAEFEVTSVTIFERHNYRWEALRNLIS